MNRLNSKVFTKGPIPLFLVFLVTMLLVGICGAAEATDVPGGISKRLETAMTDPAFAWLDQEGDLLVWVYFEDKGLQGNELQAALQEAEAKLTPRTAWRRGKVKAKGEALVDGMDLAVNRGYLQQVLGLGATLSRESRWLNAVSVNASAKQVKQIAALPMVKKVDLVARFMRPELPLGEITEPQIKSSNRWSIDYGSNLAAMEQANVPAVHEMGITGEGVLIGMLDSGFHTSHEALIGIPVLATYDFVNDDENVDNEEGDPSTAKDHGTMTMSTAMGNMPGHLVAPAFGASAVLAKTEDVAEEVPIEEDQWVAGLEWVESHGVDIVSSSLGYLDWYEFADMDGATAVTTIAADLAVGRGIVVINSAGNERGAFNHIIAPADGDSVIAVGAVTSSGDITSFSSPGPSYDGRIKPDVSALGSNNYCADPNDDSGYRSASGTSFSCPLTSGVAALILSRAPGLTPMQVREALRETASHAASPNNDFGWGIIDAYAAVNYFGPSFVHQQLSDTENTAQPITVAAVITDRVALDESALWVNYRIDGGVWLTLPMIATMEPDTYSGDIPALAAGSDVDYFLTAASTESAGGIETAMPAQAPALFYSFHVGPDVTLPVLTHNPLHDQALIQWPPTVTVQASDNLGIDRVELTFTHNNGALDGPYNLVSGGSGDYSLIFPVDEALVAIGDSFVYTVTAYDLAGIPNIISSGPNSFEIIDTLGVILVLEDTPSTRVDEKQDKDKNRLVTMVGKSSATTIASVLTAAGYVADVMPATGVTVDDFTGYQVVVLAAGSNTTPVANEATRLALQAWALAGGRLLIEGGEVGYDALSNPGYPDFAAQVLHSVDWDSDGSGNLQVAMGHEAHPLMIDPVQIPSTVELTYSAYGDQDAMEPAADAYRVLAPANYLDDGGIIVYDNNPAPQSAQIVFFAFNVEALAAVNGDQLVLNAMQFLLAEEAPPTSSMSGRVLLAGESYFGGINVSVGGGNSTVTDASGFWLIDGLYSGHYDLSISYPLFTTVLEPLDLSDNENLVNLDYLLQPVAETSYVTSPALAIPDNTPSGITSTITVPAVEAGIISEVTVDMNINHTWKGDLIVTLTSPTGVVVSLHNRSGSSSDDIIGNWPETLVVDGPGDLNDFIGSLNEGDWVLTVSDNVGSDTGTLNSWGLNFTLPDPVSDAQDDLLPKVTRLGANVPNPFNPFTTIAFDLAQPGHTRLSIFNIRGMLVNRLVDEPMVRGAHTIQWDGRDQSGKGVASGTYFYRLESGTVVTEKKMVLIK